MIPPVVYGDWCPYDATSYGCFVDGTIYLVVPDRIALEHELGHAFDEQVMTDADRWQFEVILHLHEDWWSDRRAPPAELFADAYAACRLHKAPGRGVWDVTYGYQPTPRQHQRVCALIRHASDRG